MKLRISRLARSRFHHKWMLITAFIVIVMPILIGLGLYIKSRPLLLQSNLYELLFSGDWRPLSGKYGFYPFIISSVWVTALSLLIAAPVCLLSAIHLTKYAKKWFLTMMMSVIDILAGIPSVVYGVWGILVIVPFISKHLAPLFGLEVSGYSLLAGAIVLAVMIIPFMLNIMIEIIRIIPAELEEASLALGASKWETIKKVLLRKAAPGIIAAMVLGVSRAFGETMAVLMVVGNVIKIPENLFDPAYPLPALIANNYGEMLSIPMYDSALMLAALILFMVVLFFNFISRLIISGLERN